MRRWVVPRIKRNWKVSLGVVEPGSILWFWEIGQTKIHGKLRHCQNPHENTLFVFVVRTERRQVYIIV